jgi:hypothetical protein
MFYYNIYSILLFKSKQIVTKIIYYHVTNMGTQRVGFEVDSDSLRRLARGEAYVALSGVTRPKRERAQARDPHTEYSVTYTFAL